MMFWRKPPRIMPIVTTAGSRVDVGLAADDGLHPRARPAPQ